MLARDFDWRSGRVTQWDLERLDPKIAIADQHAELKEDLAQAEYPYDVTIDVGWYGDAFIIVVVYDSDWEHPAFRRRAESLSTLTNEIHAAIKFADDLSATIA
jgi:hypothetical protein